MNKPNNKKIVIGNWKMNGSLSLNSLFLSNLKSIDISKFYQMGICVPFPYLFQVFNYLNDTGIYWGAQNISEYDKGAYTGEVSGSMLQDFACKLVIIGHSERRNFYNENNRIILNKIHAALNYNLIPIVCFGESIEHCRTSKTIPFIDEQLNDIFKLEHSNLNRIILAYEPLWAIGSGCIANIDQINEVHYYIKNKLATLKADSVNLLYGGSVKPENIHELFDNPYIDGVLVGGASLILNDFLKIALVN